MDKHVAHFISVFSFAAAGCVQWQSWLGAAFFPKKKKKITLSFCGLKCSSQTVAWASVSPGVSLPCLDLVYLVFYLSPRNKKEGKHGSLGGKKGEEDDEEEVADEEEEEVGCFTLLQPLHSTPRH